MKAIKVFLLAALFLFAISFSSQTSRDSSFDGATQTGGLTIMDGSGTQTGGFLPELITLGKHNENGFMSSGTKEGGIA